MKLPITMSEATKRLNPQLAQAPVKKMQSQGAPKASKLEDRYWDLRLAELHGHDGIVVQRQFRVRVTPWDAIIAVHYTADFAIWRQVGVETGWTCRLIEVKDSRRKPHSDELTRPKLARLTNPWISGVDLAVWDGAMWKSRTIA